MSKQQKSVLLGFSGGLDSTAAALILQAEGYRVTLVTLDTTGNPTLCEDAAAAAQKLGLEWRRIDVQEEFRKQIVEYFIEGYRCGETPAPCTRCNTLIKWKTLYQIAEEEGFDHIATGHYFRITTHEHALYVQRGVDPTKDQSYYLWQLPQLYLQRAITPMGTRFKQEIRQEFGERVPQRESMGICFLQGEDYRNFLHRAIGQIGVGEMIDREGTVRGTHAGYTDYTIGQRRGLSLPTGWAVTGIDALHNRLIVGPDTDLRYRHLWLTAWQVVDPLTFFTSQTLRLHIRGIGRNPQLPVTVLREAEQLHVLLSDDAWAPAVGQPAVFYDGDRVVGGGIMAAYC